MAKGMEGDSLKSKTFRALSWSFIESVGLQGVRLVVGIVLARMLFPAQFGLIGMLTIFIYVCQIFFDGGYGAALIQKREITQLECCTIFFFNIVVGIAAAGLLCLIAPWVSVFYKQPALTALLRALSLSIVINSFASIQNIIFMRDLNFKILTKVSLISGGLSGIIGIMLAAFGFGVWSLVAQQLASMLLSAICLWAFSSWRPQFLFSFRVLGNLFGFGSRIMFIDLINRIFNNIYSLVIGKFFSAADLGYFTRAQNTQEIPMGSLVWMVGRVAFPVFSSIQDDPDQMKRGLRKALTMLVFVNSPMMIGLAIVARPLIVVMFTSKWIACVPYFQLFCVAGLLYPLQIMNNNVLLALGRSDLSLRLEIIKKVMIAINIAVTWRWGISAMVLGMIPISMISFYLNSYYVGRLIGYSIREQIRDFFSYFIMAAGMGLAVFAMGWLPIHNDWIILIVQVSLGLAVYISMCWVFKSKAFLELWQMVRTRLPFLKRESAI
jgi:teichuronic acid exporter